MKNRSAFSPSNLLAQLEAMAELDAEVSEDLRQQAAQEARVVAEEMNRIWRVRRRPSPGRSKFMRRVAIPVALYFVFCLSLQGGTCDSV
ncbi:MAG TPA: hypothetical protein VGG20_21990, partial [Thermoanaerobaculia bacterium]